jgi:hypothetical protein
MTATSSLKPEVQTSDLASPVSIQGAEQQALGASVPSASIADDEPVTKEARDYRNCGRCTTYRHCQENGCEKSFIPGLEDEARAIYDAWQGQPGWVPWVERGNSHRQVEARALARKAFYARQDASGDEKQDAAALPADVLAALERMEFPLHESRLSGVTAQEDARCMKIIGDFIRSRAAAALQVIPEDFITHKGSWREAIRLCMVQAGCPDGASYWKHELRAFDRAYAARASTPVAAPPSGVQALHETDVERAIDNLRHIAFDNGVEVVTLGTRNDGGELEAKEALLALIEQRIAAAPPVAPAPAREGAQTVTKEWLDRAMELAVDFGVESLRVGSYERRDNILNNGAALYDTLDRRTKREEARGRLRTHLFSALSAAAPAEPPAVEAAPMVKE